MADKQDRIAKALIKKFKPYYDEKTDKLRPDAPDEARIAFDRFNELMEDMVIEDGNPGYMTETELKRSEKHK